MSERALIRLNVNGEEREIAIQPHHTLLEVIREELNLPGTKHGCELGECGTCTILADGKPILSCLAMAMDYQDVPIVTVEGLARNGKPTELQTAFADLGAAQCGYCTPGILCASEALLKEKPDPTRREIEEALAGNLCRCTGYLKIYEAVERTAKERK